MGPPFSKKEEKMKKLEDELADLGNSQSSAACQMAPARFKSMLALFKDLNKLHGPRPVRVENNRICQPIGHANFVVEADLATMLKSGATSKGAKTPSGVSLDLQLSKNDIIALKNLAGGKEVTVDDDGPCLTFANGHMEVSIAKPALPAQLLSLPFIDETCRVGELVLDADLGAMKTYAGNKGFATLLCHGDQLEQIVVRGKSPYTINKFASSTLRNRKPDLALSGQHFLALAGKHSLSLGIYRNERGFWLKTFSKPRLMDGMTTWELLHQGAI